MVNDTIRSVMSNHTLISGRSGVSSGDTEVISAAILEMLDNYSHIKDYKDLVFNHKNFTTLLVNHAKARYIQGTRPDVILASFKNVLNAIRELLAESVEPREAVKTLCDMDKATDLFEVQFSGMVFSEQVRIFNEKFAFTEKKCDETETLLKNIIDSFGQIIFIVDALGNITECNGAAKKYFSLVHGLQYPKLLLLFDYDYTQFEQFLQTYITRGRREIRLLNGTIFHIEIKELATGNKNASYIILLEEAFENSGPRLLREPSTTFMKLSKTETQVCELIYNGMRNKEIGAFMGVSDDTVKNHRKNIRNKLKLNNKKINLYYYLRENYKIRE